MKSIKNKLNNLAIRAQLKVMEFLQDESGMEIIQVLVLLALGLVLVGTFMAFSDEIMETVDKLVEKFLGDFGK